MDKGDIKLTVGLVTRDRPSSLLKTLKSLHLQNVKVFELIISDDSTNYDNICQNKLIASQYNCRYIKGPNRGLYANRNFVAKHSKGTHFRTMDDDHEFPENHIEHCINAILMEPDTIWTIGEYLYGVKDPKRPYPVPGQLHPRGYSYKPDDMSLYFGISCGATIYPKLVFERGLFNSESYSFGILYLEYGMRLRRFGFTIKPLTSTYIIHNDVESTSRKLQNGIIQESKYFAILKYSFKYSYKLNDKFLTCLQIVLDVTKRPRLIFNVIRAIRNVYKE